MGLQPENSMDAVHSQLEQSGAIQGLSDQIQENVNELTVLCRNLPKGIVRVDTKSTEMSTIPAHAQSEALITQQSLFLRKMGKQGLGFIKPGRLQQPVLFGSQVNTGCGLAPFGRPWKTLPDSLQEFERMNH